MLKLGINMLGNIEQQQIAKHIWNILELMFPGTGLQVSPSKVPTLM